MKYIKYFLIRIKNIVINNIFVILLFGLILFGSLLDCIDEDMWEGLSTLNPFDYCNLIEVDYTAVLDDNPDGSASVEITEYITFDVHASSKSNLYKELWRELPEDYVDGLKVTYDVESVTQILDNGEEIPYTETSIMYWEDSDYTTDSTMYWHHSDGSGRYPDNDESLLIYIPWTYRDKLTFKIVYKMNNAALKYYDCSELYLSMYSGNTITKLQSYKAQILIPNDIMPTTYYAYTFGTAKIRIPFTESDSINPGYYTFSIDLDQSDLKFNYHNRYIEFCLLSYGADKNIFTKYAPNNAYSKENVLDECIEENEYYENQNKIYITAKLLLLLAVLYLSIRIVKKTKENYKKIREEEEFYEPEVEYDYFREIPSDLDPIFASELVFMKDPFNPNKEKKEEYAAILLSLVRKHYVKVTKINSAKDWNKINTLITIETTHTNTIVPEVPEDLESPEEYSAEPIYETINDVTGEVLEPLTTSERLYLELLSRESVKYNYSISLAKLQTAIDSDFEYVNTFITNIEEKPFIENGVIQGYFKRQKYDLLKVKFGISASFDLAIGLILLIVVNLISYYTPMALGFGAYTILGIVYMWKYFYKKIKSNDLILFTQYGKNEQAKWCGLYNFLNSDTLMKEKEVPDLVLWEKYLIYATAFGISDKVVKALKIHAKELNINTSPVLNYNSYVHSATFHRTSRSFGHSMHTSSRGGGGSFGGHGYGGGGRGGGGGGGGH